MSDIDIENSPYIELFEDLLTSDDQQAKQTLLSLNAISTESLASVLLAAVHVFQQHMQAVEVPQPALDVVGTGGDGYHTLNFSTATAIALASIGVRVVKHGNKRVSSQCGSADVLSILNVSALPHFQFLYAPDYHPILKRFKKIREQIAAPTIFNLLGPLLNPAKPSHALIGVNDLKLLDVFADVCAQLHFQRVMIVHTGGVDELTCHAVPQIVEVSAGVKRSRSLDIKALGLSPCQLSDIQGQDAKYNAKVIQKIFAGEPHPAIETLCLNIATGLTLMDLVPTLEIGVSRAKALLASGDIAALMKESVNASHITTNS